MDASKTDVTSEMCVVVRAWDTVHVAPDRRGRACQVHRQGVLLLAFACLVLFGMRMPCALLEPEEARHAEIARQMLAQGRWLIPVLDGEDYLHKPPLLYWLIMTSYHLFGVHDWAARLVVCLAGSGVVLAGYLWARLHLGRRVAFLGALLLLLSGRFLYMQGMILFDSLLCLWVTLAWFWGDRALRSRFSWSYWLASAGACAVGVMTKGPVALALIGPPLLFLQCHRASSARAMAGQWGVYLTATTILAGPWFVYLALVRPDAARDFFFLHHVQRFVDPLDHAEPWWFFLPLLTMGMLPWSLWIAPIAVATIRNLRRRRLAHVLAGRTTIYWLAGCWCGLFFSLSGCKRAAYILPAFAPLAFALAWHLRKAWWLWEEGGARFSRPGRAALLACGILFLGASLFWLPRYHEKFGLRDALAPMRIEPSLDVICYPRSWNSVTFYLGREVESFDESEKGKLLETLEERDTCWLVVRRRDGYASLMRFWPESLSFQVLAEHSNVVVGRVVRQKKE